MATATPAPNALDGDAATPAAAPLGRTPLYDRHRALGAKLVPFAGFEMMERTGMASMILKSFSSARPPGTMGLAGRR